jgi:hypothetical protein
MENIAKDLQPCPFCGGDAYIKSCNKHLYIDCVHKKSCSCRPSTWLYSEKNIYKQIELWNRRVQNG